MTINITTRKGNKMQLINGNVLSGNTYPIKDYLRKYCGGRWDGANRVWIVDADTFNHLLYHSNSIGLRIDNNGTTTGANGANGLCAKCHSYCYGDCE